MGLQCHLLRSHVRQRCPGLYHLVRCFRAGARRLRRQGQHCPWTILRHGLQRWLIDNALYYIILNGGISSYDSYGYTSGNTQKAGTCNPSGASVGTINTCGATQKNSEADLQAAVAEQGVMGIAIDAGGIGFQLYSGGVYTSNTCSSSRLNHAVTCVGYGSLSGTAYWTVKNSWGTAWGDNGYILMQRNYNNMCGVAATPAYAIAP